MHIKLPDTDFMRLYSTQILILFKFKVDNKFNWIWYLLQKYFTLLMGKYCWPLGYNTICVFRCIEYTAVGGCAWGRCQMLISLVNSSETEWLASSKTQQSSIPHLPRQKNWGYSSVMPREILLGFWGINSGLHMDAARTFIVYWTISQYTYIICLWLF